MDDLSHLAAEAAQAGGWAAHAHYRSGALRVRSEGGPALNVVTEADLASQNAIVALLRARRPDDAIWAEEDLRTTGTTGITSLVDPLDSTASFSRGLPGWSASVGAWVAAGLA